MFQTLIWIYISAVITVVSSNASYDKLPEKVQKDILHKWEGCCKVNQCIRNSCYIVQRIPSHWPSARQRCQGQTPDWPFMTDLLRLQDQSDLPIFWNMLQDLDFYRRGQLKTIWTSGIRCVTGSSGETETKWISTDQPFAVWLEEKISKRGSDSNSCEFLTVTPAKDISQVKYEFKNQNAYHSTICEFTIPDVQSTTQSALTTQSTLRQKQFTTVPERVTSATVPSTKQTTTTSDVKTFSSKVKKISTYSPKSPTESSTFTAPSTNSPRYCKEVNASGIHWPETAAGVTVRRECPKGLNGYAVWTCDEETLTFQPDKPHIEECKHEWIDHLEDSIRNKHDAVSISTKLAKESKHNNMSHGDIIALVNLTANLFRLYVEQKKEEEFEVTTSEEIPVYYNFTKTMISSISNMLRVQIKDAWEGLNETRQTKEASTILKLVTTIGSRLSCFRTSSENLQYEVSEENIDMQTFILNKTIDENDVIQFPQATQNVKASSSITLPAHLKLEKWFSPCKTYNSALGVIYKNVGDFLKAGQQQNSSNTKVASKVLSFSLSNSTESISLSEGKVKVTLQHLTKETLTHQILDNPRCVFWNFSKSAFGEWDDSGCDLLYFNETHTVCQCEHLTNFAILMDVNDYIGKNAILTWMTYVCCGFSCIALILTIMCFLLIRSLHGRRSIITSNLCISLLISNALIIFGLDQTSNHIICAIIAGVLHFWILAAFCWMLVEGYHLYRMVILVFQRGSNPSVKYYYLFAYGVPLVIVGVSAVLRHEGYGKDKYCWLSPNEKGLMWSFVGPACAIMLINIVIFILTLRSASSVKIKKEQSRVQKIKSWLRGSISVMCLLGITWGIGLFYNIDQNLHFFSYIFTILNALQGVFIFSFHILLNEKVISYFSCKESSKYGRKKFLYHTSSNQTNSKTSTRTSLACASSTRVQDSGHAINSHIYVTPTSRNSIDKREIAEAINKNYKKNKVSHALSANGFNLQAQHDGKVRSQSASNTELYAKQNQVFHRSNRIPL